MWLLDPIDPVAYVYTGGGLLKLTSERLEIAGTEIYIDLPALFAALD